MSHIFISYSRRDLSLAQEIVNALVAEGLDTWIDWKSIPKGEDWEQEIYRGIESADAFLFLISPDSVRSVMCNKEILHAMRNHKRILPILLREADRNDFVEQAAGAEIRRLNWIHCRKELDDFQAAIRSARDTIRTDFDWLRFHTVLQTEALAWEGARKEGSRLLRGKELKEAQAQIARAGPATEPALTGIQREFIHRSQTSARRRRALPYQLALALAGVIFVGGKFYFQVIPIPRACPQTGTVAIQLESSALPEALRGTFSDAAQQATSETGLRRCAPGEEGTIQARLGYDAASGMIRLSASLPETPAYRLDLLQEIRAFGPEDLPEAEAAAFLQALAAYAVGEYPRAIELLEGYEGLSAATLVAQARLFTDDLAGSRTAYELALQKPQPGAEYTGKLYMGAALAWWRPQSYYLLSFQGNKEDCRQAGSYYARAEEWIQADRLAQYIRTAYAVFCFETGDPGDAEYVAWRDQPPQSEADPGGKDAAQINAIEQYLLALRQEVVNEEDRTLHRQRLIAARPLMLARAALSEFYWTAEDNCKDARTWRQEFGSGVISDIERRRLRGLLQAQPLFCR